jgi:hypothetical protein
MLYQFNQNLVLTLNILNQIVISDIVSCEFIHQSSKRLLLQKKEEKNQLQLDEALVSFILFC